MNYSFLFGAGASAFSGCTPYDPPLGKHLFASMDAEGFVPSDLPAEVRAQFEANTNFEHGMQALAKYESFARAPFMRGIARYFARFQPAAGNHYTALFRGLEGSPSTFHYATLNYENVIEHALLPFGVPPETVIKPHGSCSFLLDTSIGNSTFKHISMLGVPAGERLGIVFGKRSGTGQFLPSPVEIDPAAIERWCHKPNNASFYPAMSYYAEGKGTSMNTHVVLNQRAKWREALQQCDVCFIIGVACNQADVHIWDPLRDGVCSIVYVNPCDDGFQDWLSVTGRLNAKRCPLSFEAALPEIIEQVRRRVPRGAAPT